MILKENSILNFPPLLEEKELLILDTIRFTLNIIDFSYINLFEKIYEQSTLQNKKNLTPLFMYSWSIVDSSSRLVKLLKKTIPKLVSIDTSKIEYVGAFRNTFQHLDERIDESLYNFNQPFYGKLKWNYKNLGTNKMESFIAISGIFYTKEHNFQIGDNDSDKTIQNLILETVDKKKLVDIDLLLLYDNLEKTVLDLSIELEKYTITNKLELVDWKKRRDVLFNLKTE